MYGVRSIMRWFVLFSGLLIARWLLMSHGRGDERLSLRLRGSWRQGLQLLPTENSIISTYSTYSYVLVRSSVIVISEHLQK